MWLYGTLFADHLNFQTPNASNAFVSYYINPSVNSIDKMREDVWSI